MGRAPKLSRFETQCLRILQARGDASVRDVHRELPDAPSYSTVRTIFERLEEKGAIERVELRGKAWIYRSRVSPASIIRHEIRRLIDTLFGGSAVPLVAHLAEMDELSIEDLREIESRLGARRSRRAVKRPRARRGGISRGGSASGKAGRGGPAARRRP